MDRRFLKQIAGESRDGHADAILAEGGGDKS